MIFPKIILGSQDVLVSSSEGPQDEFFSFLSGGTVALEQKQPKRRKAFLYLNMV